MFMNIVHHPVPALLVRALTPHGGFGIGSLLYLHVFASDLLAESANEDSMVNYHLLNANSSLHSFNAASHLHSPASSASMSVLIVFAGRQRPFDLSSSFMAKGYKVDAIDTKIKGDAHNVLVPAVLDEILERIRRKRYHLVWIATPCASFSVFWLDPNRTTLRTRASPLGHPSLPKRWRNYVRKHNKLAEVSATIARAAFAAHATFVIENPVDRGDLSSPLFEDRFKEHAPLWLQPCIQSLRQSTSAILVDFPQCYFCSSYQKWTTLLIAGPSAKSLTPLACATCRHDHHRATRYGVDSLGRPTSEASGEYPPAFNECVATLFHLSTPPSQPMSAPIEGSSIKLPSHLSRSVSWRALPIAMPAHWPEFSKFPILMLGEARDVALRYVSRRRGEPESPCRLATRALPHVWANPFKPASIQQHPRKVSTPSGAPPHPIHISQLFYPGVYDSIRECIYALAIAINSSLSSKSASSTIAAGATSVFKQADCQPYWARQVVWDTSDPSDCKPMQDFGVDNFEEPGPNVDFFKEWAARLNWKDQDMITQLTLTGAQSKSSMQWDTVVHSHHTGLRQFPHRADAVIQKDTENGWIESGRYDLWTVPARLTPKNVVKQLKWRFNSDGQLTSKDKWRVTSDDSLAACGSDSRNSCIDPADWNDLALPSILNLAEAVAIVKSHIFATGLHLPKEDLERVALWALDLTDAYRMLKVSRKELWMQGFVWSDGVRLDRRALFGSAHLVGLFQRVSSFLLAIAKFRISEFDRHHPYDSSRAMWMKARMSSQLSSECSFADIYIDDSFGLTCLGKNEPLLGSMQGSSHVSLLLTVRSAGRVQVMLRQNYSRAQMHVAIASNTFNEAGWKTADDKQQLGMSIDLLGFSISSLADGCIYVPEAKRQGMIRDIDEQINTAATDGSIHRDKVETLVGRTSHLAMVATEGNAYLKPMFAMVNARRRGIYKSATRDGSWSLRKRLVKPYKLHVKGDTKPQIAYQMCLRWWKAAFEAGISVPLAHKRSFPFPGEPGCAFIFTDAAREEGTGYGGFTIISYLGDNMSRQSTMFFMSELWDPVVRQKLHRDELSMAAAEAFGAIALMDSLCDCLPNLSHVVAFSDSSATVNLLNSSNSSSPQMDHLMRWFINRRPSLLVMGIHIPGVSNTTSDALSRNKAEQYLSDASQAGCHLHRLRPAHECCSLAFSVLMQNQRGTVIV